MFKVIADAKTEFDFLADLEQNENVLPKGIVQELTDFKADFDEHNGLIPSGSAPALLNLSRQRFTQLRAKYGFWSAEYFEKTWYSRRELEDFYKVDRKRGRPSHSVAKVLKSLLPTVSK
jgi:hypothetical protein